MNQSDNSPPIDEHGQLVQIALAAEAVVKSLEGWTSTTGIEHLRLVNDLRGTLLAAGYLQPETTETEA